MSPMQAMLWKEWHQQRWRLAFISTVTAAFVAIGLWTRAVEDLAVVVMSNVGCCFLWPIFAAMGLVAEEKEVGEWDFQRSLPVSLRQLYLVKLAVGLVVVASPLLISMILALTMATQRELDTEFVLWAHGAGLAFGWACLIWIAGMSMGMGTQAKVALAALGVYAGWLGIIMLDNLLFGRAGMCAIVTPFGLLLSGLPGRPSLAVVVVQLAVVLGVLVWGLRRFARTGGMSS